MADVKNGLGPVVFMMGRLLAAVVVALVLIPEALAQKIDVPKDHTTVQSAIDAAQEGDTVRVCQGTYYENITLKQGVIVEGGWNEDFSQRDVSAQVTTIDGGEKGGWVVLGADNATLDGFNITHGGRTESEGAIIGGGIFCKATSPTIVNNAIVANRPAGVFCAGGAAVIMDNVISNDQQIGIFAKDGSSLTIRENVIRGNRIGISTVGEVPSQLDVRNNTLSRNKRAAIEAEAATGAIYNNVIYENEGVGIRCLLTPLEIVNNTIVANGRAGIVAESPSQAPTVKNNIITHNGDAGIRSTGKGYSYNLLFANNMTGDCNAHYLWCIRRQYGGYEDEESYGRRKDIIADPLYVDAAQHDYHLLPRSPAIDAGDPAEAFLDAHFGPSLGSSVNDMGAYGGPSTMPEERPSNDPPKAHIGPLQQVYVGQEVTLDGSDSMDPNGDAVAFAWRLLSKPEESKAVLVGSDGAKCRFETDMLGDYTAELVVKDRWGKASAPASMTISAISNRPPTAHAGEDISSLRLGDTVSLSGGGSKDPNGDALSYQWKLVFRPGGSEAKLSDLNAVNSTFMADALGCYVAQLVVNDGKVDSEPDEVYISTLHYEADRKRHVPEQYPTIQAAINAASPGDDIVVRNRIYAGDIIIDKSINLIGIGWPVIDGGSKEGDGNAITIRDLGDRAGRIEGFVITGGGKGLRGHGINIWDASPTIVRNKITGNLHNGVGVHGPETLTGKTKICENQIYDNMIGIGNGKGSKARIYNNHIYNNRVVGVGSRGLAAPRIEGNYIHENRIGIGVRAVASPQIKANHIFENHFGITVSPVSTVKRFAGDDIVIENNLIFRNHQGGISITSFNLSKVIISNNTIDSNNHEAAKTERAGGLIFGYPFHAMFTALVENNIITNNKRGGLVNFTGTNVFPSSGAWVINNFNNLWNNGEDYVGCAPGDKDICGDPLFVSVPTEKNGDYYLSQQAAGEPADSPCVDAGNDAA
ncbi:MAG: right-handed parallel beta-helix repeat-containing protein, partial [Thermodesulfobacteriota bacterium]|nr:right-handed parallel beta-helix repeat-containing protein [Thermodesulfobacteriota bacterium]